MKLCDLTVEQYLGGTGVWLIFTAASIAVVWIWKRWRAKKLAAAFAEPPQPPPEAPARPLSPDEVAALPTFESGPHCPVCHAPISEDLAQFVAERLYIRGDESLPVE